MLKKIRKTSERGQAIILIAFSIIGMVGIVGLMIDSGIVLIEYARLKRGIDSASIAAASQFRKNFKGIDMIKAGEELLKFNQSEAKVTISTCSCPPDWTTCKTNPTSFPTGYSDQWNLDETLCPANTGGMARKMVRITAERDVYFGFMKILGFTKTTIRATSVGEAASVDMVLAIDTSSSMAYETTGDTLDPNYLANCQPATGDPIDCVDPDKPDPATPGHPYGDDPKHCNEAVVVPEALPSNPTGYAAYQAYLAQRCEPLGKVRDAAVSFVNNLFFPYDRVALVAFTEQKTDNTATRKPVTVLEFSDNQNDTAPFAANTEIQEAILNLKVFMPKVCPPSATWYIAPSGSDLNRDTPGPCIHYNEDPAHLGEYVTNKCVIGDSGTPPKNPTSCGTSNIGGGLREANDRYANARTNSFWVMIALIGGPANASVASNAASADMSYCPSSLLYRRTCRAVDPTDTIRHDLILDPLNYDSDDYARDQADRITTPPPVGQGVVLFSICMGKPCRTYLAGATGDPASAEHLGQYMSLVSGGTDAKHGEYYFAVNASSLTGPTGVFAQIAKNINTRISQ